MKAVLVANRGEVARRIFRTAHSMGIRCIAVYVASDVDAPFVREADEAIRLDVGYLDGTAVIAAAMTTGAEAVHPGYGFLAENAEFARDVEAAGLIWIGPTPEVITLLGDKLAAKSIAEQAGVGTLPFSADPAQGTDVGYPLLVKAAAGGGGKGMRVVSDPADLAEMVDAAKREAVSAFDDDTVFLEHYLARSHHVEIQILGDAHGELVHLGDRECSIQRRHQKIIEESPSPALNDELRTAMCEAAVRIGRAVQYRSAGTVEFLLDADSHEFFFLEVNARLQVEHPVTEEVTGVDLVREQLRVADGHRLGFGQDEISFTGHAIEARLYAEDPAVGFLPATGILAAYEPPREPALRWDSGVEVGSVVGIEFDPMLAKVIASGQTRAEATGRLALGLERTHLGGVRTNRDFLISVLRSVEFGAGGTTTDFIDRVSPAPSLHLDESERDLAVTLAALWLQGSNSAARSVMPGVPSGWRNSRMPPQIVAFEIDSDIIEVSYQRQRDGSFAVEGIGEARVQEWSTQHIDAEVNGRRVRSRMTRAGDTLFTQVRLGTLEIGIVPRFVVPGSDTSDAGLVAPLSGVVLDVKVEAGAEVAAGEILIIIEAMKMEHHMKAPAPGVIAEVHVVTGDQVVNGQPLLSFESSEPVHE